MNTVTAGVAHHQAVPEDQSAKAYLEKAIVYDGMVKGSEPKYSGAAPAILVQFHPEFLGASTARDFGGEMHELVMSLIMSENNNAIWKTFQSSMETYRKKRSSLLNEIKSNKLKLSKEKKVSRRI